MIGMCPSSEQFYRLRRPRALPYPPLPCGVAMSRKTTAKTSAASAEPELHLLVVWQGAMSQQYGMPPGSTVKDLCVTIAEKQGSLRGAIMLERCVIFNGNMTGARKCEKLSNEPLALDYKLKSTDTPLVLELLSMKGKGSVKTESRVPDFVVKMDKGPDKPVIIQRKGCWVAKKYKTLAVADKHAKDAVMDDYGMTAEDIQEMDELDKQIAELTKKKTAKMIGSASAASAPAADDDEEEDDDGLLDLADEEEEG